MAKYKLKPSEMTSDRLIGEPSADDAAALNEFSALLNGKTKGTVEMMMPDAKPTSEYLGDMLASTLPSGDVVYDMEPHSRSGDLQDGDFHENLADRLDSAELLSISQDLIEKIEADKASIKDWEDKGQEAMVLMGAIRNNLYPDGSKDDEPFAGASTVVHPMLAEAVVQFNARAMNELLPPGGPVKTIVKGRETSEMRDKAERVKEHMNYQITIEDDVYEDDTDQMLFYLPFIGSAFKKTYFDPILQTTISRFIMGQDLVCPYTAKSLESSPRITHMFKESHNDLRKKQVSGYYRDIPLTQPAMGNENELTEAVKEAEGRSSSIPHGDEPHQMFECHTTLDLGEDEDGIELPYIVTIEKESKQILSIRRNWDETDPLRKAEMWFVHFKFMPGLGMYGFGYLHLIGELVKAATGSMRAILDAASFASLQGGFVSYDVTIEKNEFVMEPGLYKPINIPSDELAKAFYTPPFREPAVALVNAFMNIVETGRRFMSTVDVAVGDANNNGPVGTTVALIEQSTKVMSAVHKRLHRAMSREFRIRARLNRRHLPQDGLYFDVVGDARQIFPDDYADQIVIIPVSDPNVSSVTEKIAKAQALMERSTQAPDLYNRYEVESIFLDAIGVSDKDSILVNPDDAPHTSPMIEGALLTAGKPIKVYYDQNHEAHIAVHQAQMQLIMAQSPSPKAAEALAAQMQAHISLHMAYKMYQEMHAMMGMEAQPIDLSVTGKKASLPPEVENAAAVTEAQQVMQLQQAFQSMQPPPPQDAETDADIARKNKAFEAEEQRKQAEWEAEQNRKADAFMKQVQQSLTQPYGGMQND